MPKDEKAAENYSQKCPAPEDLKFKIDPTEMPHTHISLHTHTRTLAYVTSFSRAVETGVCSCAER